MNNKYTGDKLTKILEELSRAPINEQAILRIQEKTYSDVYNNITSTTRGPKKSFFIYLSILKRMSVGIVAIFVFVFAGGLSAAAQNTLPGDTLYPVKILTESVVLGTAKTIFKDEGELILETKIAKRRAKEITTLKAMAKKSLEDSTSTKSKPIYNEVFSKHLVKAAERLEKNINRAQENVKKIANAQNGFVPDAVAELSAQVEVLSALVNDMEQAPANHGFKEKIVPLKEKINDAEIKIIDVVNGMQKKAKETSQESARAKKESARKFKKLKEKHAKLENKRNEFESQGVSISSESTDNLKLGKQALERVSSLDKQQVSSPEDIDEALQRLEKADFLLSLDKARKRGRDNKKRRSR